MLRCKPSRWLLGLIPLALIALLVIYGERRFVEEDLKARAQRVLGDAGISWAIPSFEGRDGVVSGTAGREKERQRAIEIVNGVWGVRVVEDRAKLLPTVKPYTWWANRRKKTLKLKGHVPSEKDRKTVLGMARATFPGFQIIDRMKTALGAPSREAWLGGVSFGLQQLGSLKRGIARLDGTNFFITGEAVDGSGYKNILTALERDLPTGLVLEKQQIVPPRAKPFIWSVQYNKGAITFSGYVPNPEVRENILLHAKKKFPNAAIVDQTELASGQPRKWGQVAVFVLNQLVRLESGLVKLSGVDVTITGLAVDKATAENVAKTVRLGLPKVYRSTEQITAKPAARISLPKVFPYVWSAKRANGVVTLSGHVPTERVRATTLDIAKTAVPEHRVVEEIMLSKGNPEEVLWLRGIRFSLSQLSKLRYGSITLQEKDLSIEGEASTLNGYQAVMKAVTEELPSGFNLSRKKIVPPRVDPYVWEALIENDAIALVGHVLDEEAKQIILKEVRKEQPDTKIIDRMTLASGAPEHWQSAVSLSIRQLSHLEKGKIAIKNTALHIEGVVEGDEMASTIKKVLSQELPSGFTSSEAISVKPKPKPEEQPKEAPEVKSETELETERKAELPQKSDNKPESEQEPKDVAKADLTSKSVQKADAVVEKKADTEISEPDSKSDSKQNSEAKIETAAKAEQETTSSNESKATSEIKIEQESKAEPKVEPAQEKSKKIPEAKPRAEIKPTMPAKEEHVEVDECRKLLASELTKGMIQFATESAEIKPMSKPVLKKLAYIANRCPKTRIDIAGHTDSRGGNVFNKKLSQRRAESVVSYLVQEGVERSRLTASGYGETKPLLPNTSSKNRAKNRRIEFVVKR